MSVTVAPRSLVLASLEIGRELADRDGVTFRAQGTCMYPTVRPGDVLRIQSCHAADIAVGDIAVCRAPEYLFSHRVTGKGEQNGRAYIVTRPDRSCIGGDDPVFDENLLGVVVEITRKSKPVPFQPTVYPWPIRRYYKVRLSLMETVLWAQFRLAGSLARAHLDNSGFYPLIPRIWLALVRPRVAYVVQVPLNSALGDAVYRSVDPDTFDAEMEWNGRKITRWTLALHRNDAREPGAWVTFVRGAADSWRVAEKHTRLRYRGAGLDELLMAEAEKILVRTNP